MLLQPTKKAEIEVKISPLSEFIENDSFPVTLIMKDILDH